LFGGFCLVRVDVIPEGPYSEVRALSQRSRVKSTFIFGFFGARQIEPRMDTNEHQSLAEAE
jgi:hypothetical protein